MSDELVRFREAAEILGVSKRTLYRWVHDHAISYVRFPGGIRFRRSVLEQFILQREVR